VRITYIHIEIFLNVLSAKIKEKEYDEIIFIAVAKIVM
jgi:hypothetical protein